MISLNLDRLVRQFLVHSFLYYQLDESIIGDHNYDQICVQLKEVIKGQDKYLYQNIIEKSLGAEGSGFSIDDIVIENQMTYVCRTILPWRSFELNSVEELSGATQGATRDRESQTYKAARDARRANR